MEGAVAGNREERVGQRPRCVSLSRMRDAPQDAVHRGQPVPPQFVWLVVATPSRTADHRGHPGTTPMGPGTTPLMPSTLPDSPTSHHATDPGCRKGRAAGRMGRTLSLSTRGLTPDCQFAAVGKAVRWRSSTFAAKRSGPASLRAPRTRAASGPGHVDRLGTNHSAQALQDHAAASGLLHTGSRESACIVPSGHGRVEGEADHVGHGEAHREEEAHSGEGLPHAAAPERPKRNLRTRRASRTD